MGFPRRRRGLQVVEVLLADPPWALEDLLADDGEADELVEMLAGIKQTWVGSSRNF